MRYGLIFGLLLFSACYHAHPIEKIKGQDSFGVKTVVIALDGIDYDLMAELHREGYFSDFTKPQPMVSTFPSGTTIGFTGIFDSIGVEQVHGYESRFYSFANNKVVGGTPWDVYKFPIHYKYYFDYFRHKMTEKSVMYSFPSVAGQYDLMHIRELVMDNPKKLLFAYIGGTDGSAHMLGRPRTKRFLISMSQYLDRLKKDYARKTGGNLRFIMFSDHGFHYSDLKMVSTGDIDKVLKKNNFNMTSSHIESERDVLAVKYGLLSAGVIYTPLKHRREIAELISVVPGIDLVFWQEGPDKVFVQNARGEKAFFEYRSRYLYRYQTLQGDPLIYNHSIVNNGHVAGAWLSDREWLRITHRNQYPDAGRRLYDAFFYLVKNPAAIILSTRPDYQFGAAVTLIGTYTKFGQKGTHGGMFREPSLAFAMTNDASIKIPDPLRYDDFFPAVLPKVAKNYLQREIRKFTLPAYVCCEAEKSSHSPR